MTRLSTTRLGRALALTALVAFALATPLGGRVLQRACAAGDVHVAVVVDDGSSSAVSAVCVPGSSGDNGATILAARASMLGMPQPRYSTSGLLCSIDGMPSTGCGVAHDGHYAYWSYWHGDAGKWSYSNVGPASGRVDSGVVEGWRWEPDGSALPTDPPPRGPADATAICAPTPPRPTAPPTTVATAPPPEPTVRPSVTGRAPQLPGISPATGSDSPTPTSVTARPGSTASVTTVKSRGSRTSKGPPGESTSSSIAIAVRGIAAAPPRRTAGGVPVAFLAGVALVLAVGAGGAFAARRRRRPAS
jgi:hypothetical protein